MLTETDQTKRVDETSAPTPSPARRAKKRGSSASKVPTSCSSVSTTVKAVDEDEVMPPRPPNGWILYRSAKVRELREKRGQMGPSSSPAPSSTPKAGVTTPNIAVQAQMSRLVSVLWKEEEEFVKKSYMEMAEEKKKSHLEMFPNYRYRPKRVPVFPSTAKEKAVQVEKVKTKKERVKAKKNKEEGLQDETKAENKKGKERETAAGEEIEMAADSTESERQSPPLALHTLSQREEPTSPTNPFVPTTKFLDLIGTYRQEDLEHMSESERELLQQISEDDWSYALAATAQSATTPSPSEEEVADELLARVGRDNCYAYYSFSAPSTFSHFPTGPDGYEQRPPPISAPLAGEGLVTDSFNSQPHTPFSARLLPWEYREGKKSDSSSDNQSSISSSSVYHDGSHCSPWCATNLSAPMSTPSHMGTVVGEPMLTLSPLQLNPSYLPPGPDTPLYNGPNSSAAPPSHWNSFLPTQCDCREQDCHSFAPPCSSRHAMYTERVGSSDYLTRDGRQVPAPSDGCAACTHATEQHHGSAEGQYRCQHAHLPLALALPNSFQGSHSPWQSDDNRTYSPVCPQHTNSSDASRASVNPSTGSQFSLRSDSYTTARQPAYTEEEDLMRHLLEINQGGHDRPNGS